MSKPTEKAQIKTENVNGTEDSPVVATDLPKPMKEETPCKDNVLNTANAESANNVVRLHRPIKEEPCFLAIANNAHPEQSATVKINPNSQLLVAQNGAVPSNANTDKEITSAHVAAASDANSPTVDRSIEDSLPDDFFADLEAAAAELSAKTPEREGTQEQTPQPLKVKDEPQPNPVMESIPDSFFEEILVDRVAERLAAVVNEEEETKYSERLKQIQEQIAALDEEREKDAPEKSPVERYDKGKEKERSRKRSKHSKKEKRKSRKRDRERSSSKERESPQRVTHRASAEKRTRRYTDNVSATAPATLPDAVARARLDLLEPTPAVGLPRVRFKAESCARAAAASEGEDDDLLQCLSVTLPGVLSGTANSRSLEQQNNMFGHVASEADVPFTGNNLGFKRIKLEKPSADVIGAPLSAATKRDRAFQLAARLIPKLRTTKSCTAPRDSKNASPALPLQFPLVYTPTVRKLPTHSSYVTQQMYDNRSPLHTIHNVAYKFNSHATRLSLYDWGLEALSVPAARIARAVGMDAGTLHKQILTTKMPGKLRKAKLADKGCAGEEVDIGKSTCFANAMTQTDGRPTGCDISVQAQPAHSSIASQTNMSGSGSHASPAKNDGLPLMSMLRTMTENQLLALNDFAELLQEPSAESADELYRLRQRLLSIYKTAQMVSHQVPLPVLPPHAVHQDARLVRQSPHDPRLRAGVHVSPPNIGNSQQTPYNRPPGQQPTITAVHYGLNAMPAHTGLHYGLGVPTPAEAVPPQRHHHIYNMQPHHIDPAMARAGAHPGRPMDQTPMQRPPPAPYPSAPQAYEAYAGRQHH